MNVFSYMVFYLQFREKIMMTYCTNDLMILLQTLFYFQNKTDTFFKFCYHNTPWFSYLYRIKGGEKLKHKSTWRENNSIKKLCEGFVMTHEYVQDKKNCRYW